jgi:hypothetical protein
LFKTYQPLSKELSTYVRQGTIAEFDTTKASALLVTRPAAIELSFQFENSNLVLELNEASILSAGFFVSTGSNPKEKYSYNHHSIIHYKGKIKGNPKSFAAVSIMADQLVGVIADEKGNINIGAINTTAANTTNQHIIYRENELLIKNEFTCNTEDPVSTASNPIPAYTPADVNAITVNAEPVDIYFEADYTTYTNNGSSVNNVVNYVTALFNVVHLLYENDSINTKVSSIKVWNVQDPYNSLANTATALSAFANNMSGGFPGDIAHFITQRALGVDVPTSMYCAAVIFLKPV